MSSNIQTEDVILSMPIGRPPILWCELARAREKYIIPGMKAENLLMVGFGLGWVDAIHNELVRYGTNPDDIPTGSETNKP